MNKVYQCNFSCCWNDRLHIKTILRQFVKSKHLSDPTPLILCTQPNLCITQLMVAILSIIIRQCVVEKAFTPTVGWPRPVQWQGNPTHHLTFLPTPTLPTPTKAWIKLLNSPHSHHLINKTMCCGKGVHTYCWYCKTYIMQKGNSVNRIKLHDSISIRSKINFTFCIFVKLKSLCLHTEVEHILYNNQDRWLGL